MPLSAREQRVCELIRDRHAAMLEDLKLHVGLPTGGRNTRALDETRERLTARAKALGASVEIISGAPRPDWLYGEIPGQEPLPTAICRRNSTGKSGRELLIAGHLDTVHDPRGPFRELAISQDGKTATGPGCVDMKGGLVIALAALEALEEAGEKTNWTLLLNSDEETGSYHSANTIHSEAASIAARNGLGIALEPAMPDGGLVIERAGSGQFMIEVEGKAAHVGRDFFGGTSAVYRLAHIIGYFGEMMATRAESRVVNDNGLIVNIGPLQGGSATNVVPDRARAWGNVRFNSLHQWNQFKSSCDHFGNSVDHDSEGRGIATVRFSMSQNRPAKTLTPEVQEFANLSRATATDLHQPLPFGTTAGVCDGNIMQAAGLPTIDTLGVCGGGLHTPQEWIELASLVERCQLLALTMLRVATDWGAHVLEEVCGDFIVVDGQVRGDAKNAEIERRIAQDLDKVASGNWEHLFRDRKSGEYWELDYPRGSMHGGGPLRLRRITVEYARQKWHIV